jgi:hypothetical protein
MPIPWLASPKSQEGVLTMEETKQPPEYKKPDIKDYGDLRELTATQQNRPFTDVPLGQPVATQFSVPG